MIRNNSYTGDKSVIELFEQQVELTPDLTALIFGDAALTYKELNQRVNQLAAYLRINGVKAETLVPLFIERGLDMIIGLLGIMKAGCVYVPIDSDTPQARIDYILQDTEAKVVVTSKALMHKIASSEVQIIALDNNVEIISKQLDTDLLDCPKSNNLAYIIYTSGSTGQPKGVMIEHRSLVDYVYGLKERTELEECKSFALVSTIATDLGNTVIYGSLLTGGALHVFSKETVSNIEEIHRYFKTRKIDCLKIVPSHWKALRMDDTLLLPQKLLIFGGEALQSEILDNIREANAECTVVNHYGPTETTIGKLLHVTEIQRKYGRTIPIGKPFGNTKVYILSKSKTPCPIGVAGELYIGGDGLARGYLNNDALSKEKFIQNPFSNAPNDLIYATGDSVKYLPDGNIEYLGRIDEQLKIRGYRIEPGEIESSLEQIKTIERAVVVAKEDKQGNKRLVAYIVPNAGFEKEEVISQLKESLPDYMIPAQWIEIESVPLMASGKTDRKALPDADLSENLSGIYVAPTDETEQRLATIWEDILEVEKVGINDDFFELGGHSLLAIRLISAIRKAFEVEMPIGDIFDYPTIALLKTRLETSTETVLPPIQKAEPRPERIPLSFSQERLWFIDRLEGSLQYHIPTVLRLKGELNKEALEQSIRKIIQRHEVLRTVIKDSDGEAYQQINNSEDWKLEQTNGSEGDLEDTIEQLINIPFDLSKDYMLRCTLIEQSQEEHTLVAVLHHIASDGWSTSVIVSEFVELYKANLENREAQLPELSVQYADFAIWQRNYLQGEVLERKLEYWKRKLKDAIPLELPTDYIRPAIQSTRGDILHLKIEKKIAIEINQLSQQQGTTLFMTLLSAFKVLMYRYSAQTDICIGTPMAGRQQEKVENLIGFFINTLVLRSFINPEEDFIYLLQDLKSTTLEAYQNQDAPFEKVVDAVVNERDSSRSPLYQVLFTLQNLPEIPELKLGELKLSNHPHRHNTSQFDLIFNLTDTENGLSLSIEYCTALFKKETVLAMQSHFVELLKSIINNPSQKIRELQLLSNVEKQQLLIDFNSTESNFKENKTVVELFEEQVKNNPNSLALVFKNEQLTYKELNEKANHLANYLIDNGVQSESFVPICIERSLEMVIGIIGILKSGGVYVPIDHEFPKSRIDYIIEDLNASILISSTKSIPEHFNDDKLKIVLLDSDWSEINKKSIENPQSNITQENPAYIIYTSGSTGKPKGVLVEHQNLSCYLLNKKTSYISEESNNSGSFVFLSYTFDASLTALLMPLVYGKPAIIGSMQTLEVYNDENFLKYAPYDFLKITPSHLELLKLKLESSEDKILTQTLVIGGESLYQNQISYLSALNYDLEIVNEYGPTEATVGCTLFKFNQRDIPNFLNKGRSLPIGKPIDNCEIYILDETNNLVPVGVYGEICIGGNQIARGYLNNKILTSEKFIDNPYSDEKGSRIYKSGDIGRWLSDGNLEFFGRKDEQVKIRGYRIELGEIENFLKEIETIKQAVVLAQEDSLGSKHLIGYVVSREGYSKDATFIRLREMLPDYMVPDSLIEIEAIPLTTNGKIDKRALPKEDVLNSSQNFVEPKDVIEKRLAEIWKDLLEIEKVSVNDNFFNIGGHSLLAMRLLSAIRKVFDVEMPIGDIFDYPTIASLKIRLETSTETLLPTIQKAEPRPERIPLSFSQERLWFIDRLEGSLQYHIPTVLQLKGNLNKEALEKSIRKIIERHEVLRTVIKDSDGEAYQQINNSEDWNLEQTNGSEGNLEETIQQLINTPFDLSKDYMLRCTLIEQSQDEHTLVAVLHHIASDGWSTSLLVKEVVELYKANLENREAQLPELSVQYADFAIWQRNYLKGEVLANKLAYWNKKLEGTSALMLPTDFPRPTVQNTEGASLEFKVDKQLTTRILALSLKQNTTLFMTLLAVFKVLLRRYSGNEDICVGTPIASRQQQEIENLIGFFINTLALRNQVKENQKFTELLEQVKVTTLEAYAHQVLPFEKVVEAVVKQRDLSSSPLFQTFFVLQNTPDVPELQFGDINLKGKQIDNKTSRFEIGFNILETEEGLKGFVQYRTELYSEKSIKRLIEHFKQLLTSVVLEPEQKIGKLSMISPSEEIQLLNEFNSSSVVYPRHKSFISLFEEQVIKTPNAIALKFENESLTFSELNHKANQLSHYLQAKGVKNETLVPICLERGLELIIGILGILKSGGAYVPIDPEFPKERIQYILKDIKAALCVSSKLSKQNIPDQAVDIIDLETEWPLISRELSENLSLNITATNLMYIIYTSGSTGRPKGVMVENRALLDHCYGLIESAELGDSESFALFSPIVFDAGHAMIFVSLLKGASLHILSKEILTESKKLNTYIKNNAIDCIKIIPSLWLTYAEDEQIVLPKKSIIFGGESFPVNIIDQLRKSDYEGNVFNHYGPTEATIGKTIHSIDLKKTYRIVPIGKPFSNSKLYVLNESESLVPLGVSGELHIAGDGLARGYLNLEKLTSEKFVSNPFGKASSERMYKTGDMVKWLEDGNIEYLGRKDNQVKINGYRIETGEIENVILEHPGISQAVVLTKDIALGRKYLVAYVIPIDNFDNTSLLDYLKSKLPEYMIPQNWVELQSFPVTSSGKIDRNSLANLEASRLIENHYTAPRNNIETKLVEIWQDLLKVDLVGIDDNFFSLGGHSLLVMRVVSAIRKEMNLEIAIKELFQYPTISELAAYLATQNEGILLPSIQKVNPRPEKIPLSFSQERLWFIDKLEGSLQYHLPTVLRLRGELNHEALERSIRKIIQRHEVLRTAIKERDGEAYQQINNSEDWKLEQTDGILYHLDPEGYLQDLIKTPFDLSKDYMLRCDLIKISNKEHLLVATLHHIASDAWSTSILVGEFVELYNASLENREALLPELSLQYADYSIWQRNTLQGEILENKLDYWKQKLEAITALELPTDYIRPAVRGIAGSTLGFKIDKQLSDKITQLSQSRGATLFMTLLAAYKTLLYRYSGQNDISVGTSIASRPLKELEELIGFFVNTLTLRDQVEEEMSFMDLLSSVKTTTLEAYQHQDIPFEKVVDAVVKGRDQSRSPLFQVMLVLANTPESETLRLGDVEIERERFGSDITKFDMTFFVNESEEGLYISIQYATDLFKEETVTRMGAHFVELLKSIIQNPEQKLGQFKLLSPSEEQELLHEINSSEVTYPKDKSIVELFEQQVELTPDSTALVFGDEALSYKELNQRANQLANYLQTKGVTTQTLVPLYTERGEDMIIGMLGILKAGGVYVPIDSESPQARINFVLEDTKAKVVVSQSGLKQKIKQSEVIDLDTDKETISKLPTTNPTNKTQSNNLAYIIYTSGSTGQPKGVMIEHRSLVDYVYGLKERTELEECKSFALVSTIATDLGNTVIYGSLLTGGALHVFSKETVSNIEEIHRYFKTRKIDCLKIVPSHWKALRMDDTLLLPQKLLIFGGEALQSEILDNIREANAECTVINHYGPTETTIGKLLHVTEIQRKYGRTIPIGKPFGNTRVYILSKSKTPCPIGVAGELYIGGDGLARGYLKNDALSKEKFIQNPFSNTPNDLIYATGDSVKYLPDGNIEYLGRIDEQLKIRGYRIEPGEIESSLEQIKTIERAVVVAKEDKQGNKRLVAYIVPNAGFEKEEIISQLKESLPEYMIPAQWIEIESVPLMASGKTDRKALPDADLSENLSGIYVAPTDETEQRLATIWEDILEVEKVGINDDFFELGGHSLLAIRLISAIRKAFEVEMPIGDIFDYPTIALLKTRLETSTETVLPPIQKAEPRPERIPLSFSQERLWFIDRLEGSLQYHIPTVLQLKGNLNKEALEKSIRKIIERHEVLRTVIKDSDGEAYQQINNSEDWNLEQTNGSEGNLEETIQQLINTPFDLSKDYMLRCTLIEQSQDEHTLVAVLHHIASDGWSTSLLVKEVVELYKANLENRDAILRELSVQYADFAIWQRNYLKGEILNHKIDYWKQKLEDVETLELPTDYNRPVIQSTKGAIVYQNIDKQVAEKLNSISQQQGTTLFMTLLSAFKVLLYRYSGQTDICVGTPIAGRQQREVEDLIGFFINTLALRTELDPEKDFIKLLQAVKSTTLEAYKHQEAPFEKVVEAVVKERDMSRSPIFQAMFIFQNTPDVPEMKLGEVDLLRSKTEHTHSKFELSFNISERSTGLSLAIEYCTDLFKEETIIRLQNHFSILLNSIVSNPSEKIGNLQILSSDEELQLKETFNNTKTAWPEDKTVVELFEEQVTNTPDNVALVFENQQLTYKELNQRANQLAHYLRSKGVQRETLVPICIERSMDMMIAILGVLKSGGAYVPIDPEYPAGRIAFMLEDTNAKLVLSHSSVQPKLSSEHCEVIALDSEHEAIAKQASNNPELINSVSDLAYIIYTSGSTGQPKGVMVEQGNIVSLVKGIDYVTLDQKDVLLSTGSPSFDATTIEYWGMLLNGGKLVICRENTLLSSELLKQEIIRSGVTKMWFTSSWFNQLVESDIAIFKTLKTIIAGGEKLSEFHIEKVRQTYPELEIINGYGPTENTTFSLTYNIRETEIKRALPIGRPLNNRTAYILDKNRSLLPVGVNGEIYLGGAGLSRGYLNNALLTEEKFIQNPFSKDPNSRLYKTGDIGRWLPEGIIEYTGRKDDQVKIRGYRIELGEIENAIQKITTISHSVVLTKEDLKGYKRLIAYYVPKSDFSKEVAIAELSEKLPDYMVPQIWVELQNIPLTANGKIDKRALPDPDIAEQLKGQYVAPGNETETKLAEIWKELLDLERIGIHDNFFELGGDSILTIQLSSRAGRQGLKIQPKDIFLNQTISKLAKAIIENTTEQNRAEQGILEGEAGLTPIQSWFLETDSNELSHFSQSVFLEIDKKINHEHLSACFKALSLHHDTLRMRYKYEKNAWNQSYGNKETDVLIEDFTQLKEDTLAENINSCGRRYHESLNIEKGELVRVVWIKTPESELNNRLLIIIHHLLIDGVSWRILLEDIELIFSGLINHIKPELGDKTSSFRQWYETLQVYGNEVYNKGELKYWTRLKNAYQPIPVDMKNTEVLRVKDIFHHKVALNKTATKNLIQEVSKAFNTEINDLLLCSLAMTLSAFSKQNQFVIGLEGHGREPISDQIDTSRTIGWFTSLYPVLLEIESGGHISDHIKNIKEQLRLLPDKGIGYGILKYLKKEASLQGNDPWDIVFNYLGQLDNITSESLWMKGARESTGSGKSAELPAREKLSLNAKVQGGEMILSWSYSSLHFKQSTIEKLATDYLSNLENLILACLSQKEAGTCNTPSDFGLSGDIKFQELDKFLNEPFRGETRRQNIESIYRLSGLQQGMLFHTLYDTKSNAYVEKFSFDLSDIVPEYIQKSWNYVIKNHSILRSAFFHEEFAIPVQVVFSNVEIPITWLDYRHLSDKEQKEAIKQYEGQDVARGLEMKSAPLMRLGMIRLSEQNYRMVWTFHHILADGWSMPILMEEFLRAYDHMFKKESLPSKTVDRYEDYIHYIENTDAQKAKNYWTEYLTGLDHTTQLPFISANSERNKGVGKYDVESISIDSEMTLKVQAYAQSRRITINTLMQGIWAYLLSCYSGNSDVTFGVIVSGRPDDLEGVEQRVGMYINTLPLYAKVDKDQKIGLWLEDLQADQILSRNYQYSALNDIQSWIGVQGDLFDTLLVFENFPVSKVIRSQQWSLNVRKVKVEDSTNYPLTLTIGSAEQLNIRLSFNSALINQKFIKEICDQFEHVLLQIIDKPEESWNAIELLTPPQKNQVLREFNDTKVDYPKDKTIIDLFEQQALKTPEAIAVVFDGEELSYKELNERANQLAHYLKEKGVKPETLVAICVERSLEMIVGILGILKSGGAYVPIDPEYPQSRISFILEDSKAEIVLTSSLNKTKLIYSKGIIQVQLDSDWNKIAAYPVNNLSRQAVEQNLAYVIYTSGSTGVPKGVMVEHHNLVAYLLNGKTHYVTDNLKSSGSFIHLSYTFDASLTGMFIPLVNGKLIVMSSGKSLDVFEDSNFISYAPYDFIKITPSHLAFLQPKFEGYKEGILTQKLVIGGESLQKNQLEYLRELTYDIEIINEYGPTEATVGCSVYKFNSLTGQGFQEHNYNIPIGKPIDNTTIVITDSQNNLLPVGVFGELSIGGAQVARGYLNNPNLTAKRFIKDPFSEDENARIYKTGDVGRWLPDGNIEFSGRIDDQIKIRGYRVEPGEIEVFISSLKGVSNTKVIVQQHENLDDKRLTAYVQLDNEKLPLLSKYAYLLNQKQIQKSDLHILPNGLPILNSNLNEVRFLYQEIFEDHCYLKHGITLNENSCVVDIGANAGFFNVFLNALSKEIKIYAFEPIPEVFHYLESNRSLYNIKGKAFQLAIMDEEKEIDFNYFPEVTIVSGISDDRVKVKDVVRSYIENSSDEVLSEQEMEALLEAKLESKKIVCQAKTLSQIIKDENIDCIDLLKIDVENSEHLVLNGIREKDWDKIKSIIIEVHDVDGRLQQIKSTLELKGFKTFIEKEEMLSKDDILYNLFALRTDIPNSIVTLGDRDIQRSKDWQHPKDLIQEIRLGMEDVFPEYMIPSQLVLLDKFPITTNGKIDLKALPKPEGNEYEESEFKAAENELESSLLKIWQNLLEIDKISIHDDFFNIGGHSLLAIRLIAAIRKELEIEVTISEVFDNPTIALLSAKISSGKQTELLPPIMQGDRTKLIPLSFSQERLWFIDRLEGSLQYHLPTVLRLKGQLDIKALEKSIRKILERHEVLRTVIKDIDGEPYQQINPADGWLFEYEDGSFYKDKINNHILDLIKTPFNLAKDYMIRVRLIKISEEEYILVSTIHHIASDAWSISILVRELVALYEAYSHSMETPLPSLALQYADFAIWQRNYLQGEVLSKKLDYWKKKLKDTTSLELPTDFARPPIRGMSGASVGFITEKELLDKLYELSNTNETSLFMTLLAAFQILLYLYSGQEDICVGTSISNRPFPEVEDLIGFFINTLALRSSIDADMTFVDFLKTVKTTTLDAYQNQEVPFEKVVDAVIKERDPSRTPLFQVMMVLNNNPESDQLKLGELELIKESNKFLISKFDLTLFLIETPRGLRGSIHFATDLFLEETISRIGNHFVELLKSIVLDPNQEIGK